jgi:hypothetical protein
MEKAERLGEKLGQRFPSPKKFDSEILPETETDEPVIIIGHLI